MLKKVGWIACLVAIVGSGSIARSQSENSVAQQLIGRWEGKIEAFDIPIGIRFSSSGKMIYTYQVGFDSRTQMATVLNYSIDPKPKPMHLDLRLEKATTERDRQPVLTIFDFPKPGKLRLHFKNIEPGKPRPTQFDEPIEVSKVSDSATVFPDAAKLSEAERSSVGEGRLVMQNMALSALYYSLEAQQFPTIAQLGLNQSETQNYRYQLQATSDYLTLIARPKKENLKSYIGVVLRWSEGRENYASTHVCESLRPARIAPPMPKLPNLSNTDFGIKKIQCGSGSTAIDF